MGQCVTGDIRDEEENLKVSTEFTAIDFETANADMASICQVGVATFQNGQLAAEWKSYVDPDDYFDPVNVSIHGIDEEKVRTAPRLPQVFDQMCRFLYGRVSVCHTHFDRVAVQQACEKYGLKLKPTTWLDTARVARRAWQQFASRGYGLANVCKFLKYEYRSHDALEDAKAAGHVLLAAISSTGLDLDGWLERVTRAIDPSGAKIAREGDPDGPLYGEVIAFTGALQIRPRLWPLMPVARSRRALRTRRRFWLSATKTLKSSLDTIRARSSERRKGSSLKVTPFALSGKPTSKR
jgi:DNA polymerase-3 subunit epsilon